MNIVVQHNRGRLTVDKTMRVSAISEFFNLSMDLEVDEQGKRYLLVRFASGSLRDRPPSSTPPASA